MSPPTVSVCTTILNEGPRLRNCLKTFRQQLEPGDEIVIVDAGSNDGSIEVEKIYADVVIIHPPLYGKPITRGRGRQIATEEARGDIIVSVDGDCTAIEGYLEKYRQHFFNNPECEWAYADVIDTHARPIRNLASKIGGRLYPGWGCNSAFRKETFLTTKGYKDKNWCEDTELYRDFPGKKEWVDNPIMMELSARWVDSLWLGTLAAMGTAYLVWKLTLGEGGLEEVDEW